MKTTTSPETALKNRFELFGWPASTTLGELTEYARRRLGKRYAGVCVCKYGGGVQVEVRRVKVRPDGSNGWVREACYDLA